MNYYQLRQVENKGQNYIEKAVLSKRVLGKALSIFCEDITKECHVDKIFYPIYDKRCNITGYCVFDNREEAECNVEEFNTLNEALIWLASEMSVEDVEWVYKNGKYSLEFYIDYSLNYPTYKITDFDYSED